MRFVMESQDECGRMSGDMKTSHTIGLVVIAILISVAIEEFRIAGMKKDLEAANGSVAISKRIAADRSPAPGREESENRVRPPRHESLAEGLSPKDRDKDEEPSLAKTARKMWDSPAGRAMMNRGVKLAVGMMYDDYIEGLNLTKEESAYFKNLLGREISKQQELGMKMMSATSEERMAMAGDLEKLRQQSDEDIKTFLNNDEDYERYKAYKERLPEHQQLDGIRATMESKGEALDAATQDQLVEAMYKVRTESKGPDFSGPDALKEMAKGNMAESFERNWDSQQQALRNETSKFLRPTQQEAFQDYQKQMKEMQLMGLRMADQMMKDGKDKSK